MIKNKKILAIIPARGGSKRLVNKNILSLMGKPLIAWTIEAAKKSRYIDRVILSSEDEKIIKVVKRYGCEVPFKRPRELARDKTTSEAVVLHAIQRMPEYDYIVLLQPTSPLRTAADIDACISQSIRYNLNVCVSMTIVAKRMDWLYGIKNGRLYSITKQTSPGYLPNGAVYVVKTDWFLKYRRFMDRRAGVFVMPWARSVDIDTKEDFILAKQLFKSGERK